MAQSTLKLRMLEVFRFRMFTFLALVSILFFVLIIQLINIQLIQGEEYSQKSKMNMENNIPLPAPRGEIYDRNFQPGAENAVLASNRPSFNINTIPGKFKNKEELRNTISKLSRLLNLSYDEIIKNINEQNPWERVVIKEDVDFTSIIKIASHQELFPNIEWDNQEVRVYNLGNIFFHTVGYVGSISREEYIKYRDRGYKYYHKIGVSGLEREYDLLLRGSDGYIRRIVDVKNRIEGEEIGLYPIAGNNLILTIDSEVQTAASEAMEGMKGAVIVTKPSTGEILAFISKPDIDPNLLISKSSNKIIQELANDKEKPFLNRAIQARYAPASTFKLVTAISGLEEDQWNPNRIINCTGRYALKGYKDKNYYHYDYKSHGKVDLAGAIAESCCVYFYNIGYSIGPSLIFKYSKYFAFDEKTGIDLPDEIAGFIPSKEWKVKNWGEQWYDGDTMHLSIGQGFILVTVAGITNFISAIVNNGIIYKPHLVKEIRSPDNITIIKKTTPEKIREIPLSKLTLDTVKRGMRFVVKDGTGKRLSYLKVPIAGKTGTAQTGSSVRKKDDASQHAWFISYAPFGGDPDDTVVVVVFVEHGIAGAVTAVPVAEKIYTKLISLGYF